VLPEALLDEDNRFGNLGDMVEEVRKQVVEHMAGAGQPELSTHHRINHLLTAER
jgi:hypothetical protein